jgi:hypothetical protein
MLIWNVPTLAVNNAKIIPTAKTLFILGIID